MCGVQRKASILNIDKATLNISLGHALAFFGVISYLDVIKKQPITALRSSSVLAVGGFGLQPIAHLNACIVEYSFGTLLLIPRSETIPINTCA
jgi:hypothetical protein